MTSARQTQKELQTLGRSLREAIPGVYAGYAQMHGAVMSEDGVLPAKFKELIALAIAVTRECDGCISAHARGAARRGATAQEVAEAMGVAILLNGGPGTVWGPRAYAAFAEFAAPEEEAPGGEPGGAGDGQSPGTPAG
ncbi:MAG: carboxymuconolactone decarboxylase family protein [Gemmatimonadota bacterium]